jgi:hypothetical protein
MKNHLIALVTIALVSLPASAADAQLEALLVTREGRCNPVGSEKPGKTRDLLRFPACRGSQVL